jgi:hypothetical protein
MTKAEIYQDKIRQCERLAAACSDAEAKARLQQVANQWRQMADKEEEGPNQGYQAPRVTRLNRR